MYHDKIFQCIRVLLLVKRCLYHNKQQAPTIQKICFQSSQDDEILKEAENYIQSSRTVRFDDDSDDDNDKDAEAITKALEKRVLDKYEKNAIKSAGQRGSEEEDEDEEEEGSDEEEEPILPATGVSQNHLIAIRLF